MKALYTIPLFLLFSCSHIFKKHAHINNEEIQTTPNKGIYKKFIQGFYPQKGIESLNKEQLNEDMEVFSYVVKNTHPFSFIDDQKKKEIDDVLKLIKSNFKGKNSQKICEKINSIPNLYKKYGIKAHLFGLNNCSRNKTNEKKEFNSKWTYKNIDLKNDNIGYFKFAPLLKHDKNFFTKLIYSMNHDDGLILDLRDLKFISYTTTENIKAHFWGVPVRYDHNPKDHVPFFYDKRFYVHNWITYFAKSVRGNDMCNGSTCMLPHEYMEKMSKLMKGVKDRYDDNSIELQTFDLSKLPVAKYLSRSVFKKPIYIFVDDSCANYCENIVLSLKEIGNVHVIGRKTSGRILFEDSVGSRLKNSRLLIEVPYNYASLKKEHKNYQDGYQPKYLVKKESDYINIFKKIHRNKYYKKDQISKKNKNVKIVFIRPDFIGFLVSYDIYLNGKKKKNYVGETKGQEYIEFEIKPGKHTFYQKMAGWSSVSIDAKAGDEYYFYQVHNPSAGNGFMTGASITLIPSNTGESLKKGLSLGSLKK